tara:strand:+ start:2012 stop:3016 length:1005 start_codon:yes stop_codon:yes gene_type:complete
MFEYFYHEIFRRTIIAFGTLFNNIQIQKTNSSGQVTSIIKVPLAYGPTQKFLARLEQQPDLNKPIQITLPRMSFEFVGLNYDTSRKLTTTQTFLSASVQDKTDIKKTYFPVPYNMEFELSIMCKHNDDMLQIIEQIIPYFQPSFTLSVDLIKTIGEKRDIPITLNNISMQDDYEGDFSTRRALIYTLRFTAKTYLFGPVLSGVDKDIIKKISIGFVSGDSNSTTRDLTYSQEPVATKSYANNTVTNISKDIEISSSIISVSDSSSIPLKSYITINNETLQVTKKDNNDLTVVRGAYNTPISIHVSGSEVNLITEADSQLIEFGDDFGFGDVSFS